MKLKYAELHTPMFLSGKNMGTKLDPSKLGGLSLDYDRQEKELIVSYNGQVAIVPNANVANAVLENPGELVKAKK